MSFGDPESLNRPPDESRIESLSLIRQRRLEPLPEATMKTPLRLTTISAAILLGLSCLTAQTATQPTSKAAADPVSGASAQERVTVHAKKDDISKLDRSALLEKLNGLLKQIESLMKAQIDPAKVEDRLLRRTPVFRQVPITDAPKDVPVPDKPAEAQPGQATQETAKTPVRLFGDSEKADLPKGTIMIVEGMNVGEDEIKGLETFYDSYTSSKPGTSREKALEALIIVKSVQAKYQAQLPKLEKEMAEIRKLIVDEGQDFAEVAKKRSHGPSSNQGGDLGFFSRDSMVPAFSQAAFALKLGEVSGSFASPFGIHILKVTGRKKGATPSEDQVRASHILLLYDKDSNALRGLMQKAAQGQCKIAILDDEWRKSLPAAYR